MKKSSPEVDDGKVRSPPEWHLPLKLSGAPALWQAARTKTLDDETLDDELLDAESQASVFQIQSSIDRLPLARVLCV